MDVFNLRQCCINVKEIESYGSYSVKHEGSSAAMMHSVYLIEDQGLKSTEIPSAKNGTLDGNAAPML